MFWRWLRRRHEANSIAAVTGLTGMQNHLKRFRLGDVYAKRLRRGEIEGNGRARGAGRKELEDLKIHIQV